MAQGRPIPCQTTHDAEGLPDRLGPLLARHRCRSAAAVPIMLKNQFLSPMLFVLSPQRSLYKLYLRCPKTSYFQNAMVRSACWAKSPVVHWENMIMYILESDGAGRSGSSPVPKDVF